MNLFLLSISLLSTSVSLILHFYQCLYVLVFSISVPVGLFSITIYRPVFPTNVSIGLCFISVSLYGLVYPTVTPMASNESIKCYSLQLRSNNAHCYPKMWIELRYCVLSVACYVVSIFISSIHCPITTESLIICLTATNELNTNYSYINQKEKRKRRTETAFNTCVQAMP